MGDNDNNSNGKVFDLAAQKQKLSRLTADPNSKFNVLDLMDGAAQIGYRTAKMEMIEELKRMHDQSPLDATISTRGLLKKIIIVLERSGG